MENEKKVNIFTQDMRDVVKLHLSNRRYDDNGYLHVDNCILTAEEVSDYLGKSITGWRDLGLEENKIYGIYRPKEELEKAVSLYNNLPLTDNHIQILPDRPRKELIIGSLGTDAILDDNNIINSVVIWDQKAIDEIKKADENENNGKKDLSVGYNYTLIIEEGVFQGKHYDFIMKDIKPNHVALVEEGRVLKATIADCKDSIVFKKGKSNMTFSLAKLLRSFAKDNKDGKIYDESGLQEIAKNIVGMTKDENYEGKEDKLIAEIQDILTELHNVQTKEKAEDDEELESRKERADVDKYEYEQGKNAERKELAKDKEEELEPIHQEKKPEKEHAEDDEDVASEANDSLDKFVKVLTLSQQIVGKISNDLIATKDINKIMDKVFKAKGVAVDSKDDKIQVLELMAKGFYRANDSKPKISSVGDSNNMNEPQFFNPLKRKERA